MQSTSQQQVYVDIFEKSPFPFGLVRYGVAPDHGNIKVSIGIHIAL